MPVKKEFYYLSEDGETKIHAIEWIPEGDVKAVLQICHGMSEYIGRYDEFARYLNERGIYVTGHDHLGHGDSIRSPEYYGYFHEKYGNRYVIGDIQKLREMTGKKYPDVPYFMLGHSMGSFLLRQYLTMYGEGLKGAVIMGTGHYGIHMVVPGQILCRITAACKGWSYRSAFIDSLSFGGFNKKFEKDETGATWLSADVENCRKYAQDEKCSFMFTVNGYYHLFEGLKQVFLRENRRNLRRDLPVFFVAGSDDPVGKFGKGVYQVYRKYQKAGVRDVQLKLYRGDRHEILNETDRDQVYADLFTWLSNRM